MKSLVLVEPAMHHEVLDVYLLYLSPFVGKIHVFTTQEVKDLLSATAFKEHIVYYIHDKDFAFNDWMTQYSEILESVDTCIVTTHQIGLNEFVDPSGMKNPLLVVHNTFSTFYPYKYLHLSKSGRDFFSNVLRLARSIVMGHERKKRQSLSGFFGFLATSGQQLDFITSHFPELKEKFLFGPLSYFLQFSNPKNLDKIKIVIPGTVDVEVRDYEIVYHALNCSKDLSKIELILLGKIKNRRSLEIAKKFARLSELKEMSLTIFDQTIPTEIYNNLLFTADFLIIPNRPIIRAGISYSKIGQSSISGAIADAILYAQPCLIPKHLIIPAILSGVSETFDGIQSLAFQIQKWTKESYLQKIRLSRDPLLWEQYGHHLNGRALRDELQRYIFN